MGVQGPLQYTPNPRAAQVSPHFTANTSSVPDAQYRNKEGSDPMATSKSTQSSPAATITGKERGPSGSSGSDQQKSHGGEESVEESYRKWMAESVEEQGKKPADQQPADQQKTHGGDKSVEESYRLWMAKRIDEQRK